MKAAHSNAQGNPASPPGIEGVKMRKDYYTRMRKFALTVPCFFAAFAAAALGRQPAQLKTTSLESHEGMTISARPLLDPAQYKENFPKKSPYGAGVLAVKVVFRNDSDQSLKVNLERIRLTFHLEEDSRQEVQPLTPEQVADAIAKPGAKDPTKRRRLPIPLPSSGAPKNKTDKNWVELQKEAQEAGVPSSVVAAHSSVSGLLYFDMQGQFDLLSTSHLYVPNIEIMGKSASLTYFEIDMSHSGTN
jgi:hypothetical protein